MGDPLNNRPPHIPTKWIDSEFKILGIKCSTNHQQMSTLNCGEKIKKLRTVINMWSCRNLTYQGENLLMKSLGISMFLYIGQNIRIEQGMIEVQSLVLKYIWDNKPAKIRKEVMYQEINKGGIT